MDQAYQVYHCVIPVNFKLSNVNIGGVKLYYTLSTYCQLRHEVALRYFESTEYGV